MNIITLIHKSTGVQFKGFIDRDQLTRNLTFYYYDEVIDHWVSAPLLDFKPIPEPTVAENKVIGG